MLLLITPYKRRQVYFRSFEWRNYQRSQMWMCHHLMVCAIMAVLTSPCDVKPIISWLMDDVLPDWISCKCRNRFSRALPRPLSSSPWVSTPRRVLLPASIFPKTANRMSKNCWSSGTFRIRTSCTQRCSEAALRTLRRLSVVRLAPNLWANIGSRDGRCT